MRFLVADSEQEFLSLEIDPHRSIHYPSRDGTRPICGTGGQNLYGVRRIGKVTCEHCAGLLMAERLWRRRGLCVRPSVAARLAA